MTDPFQLDKRQIRRAFERAAGTYAAAAVLQREVARRMLERLDYIKYTPPLVLDAGSGTAGGKLLRERYPQAQVIALDLALAMLQQAQPRGLRRYLPLAAPSQVCGDLEQLPLKSGSVGMVWSNLAVQWSNDPRLAFAEALRVLQTQGLFMFSTFGPDTLQELRAAYGAVDGYVHVNRFFDLHDVGDMLVECGFADPVMDVETITMTYSQVIDLMHDLKAIGAHNVAQGRRHGLTGKTRLTQVIERYEALRRDGRLPATYEVVYGHAWKPQPRIAADGSRIIQFDVKARRR